MKSFKSIFLSLSLLATLAPLQAAPKTTTQKVLDKAKIVGWAGAAGVTSLTALALVIPTIFSFVHFQAPSRLGGRTWNSNGFAEQHKKSIRQMVGEYSMAAGEPAMALTVLISAAHIAYVCSKKTKEAIDESKKETV